MKAIILAAGMGTRLMPLTLKCPKALVPVEGASILEHIIGNCVGNVVDEFIIVEGYRKEKVVQECDLLSLKYDIRFIHVENDHYGETNTGFSLLCGLEFVSEDFLIINGDNVFDNAIISDLLDIGETCLAVDGTKILTEESFKIKISEYGIIEKMGKEIPIETSTGEFIGVSIVRKKDLNIFKKILNQLVDKNPRQYYDVAFVELSSESIVNICYTKDHLWTEVDTLEDYECAKKIMSTLKRHKNDALDQSIDQSNIQQPTA